MPETTAVRRVKLELLLQKFGPGATLAILPFAGALALLFYLQKPSRLIVAWICIFYALAAVRYWHMRLIVMRGRLSDEDLEPVLKVITRYMIVTGMAWGLAPWMVMPWDEGLHKTLMTAFILGVISTAGTVYAAHRRTITAVHVPAGIGLVTAYIFIGGWLDWLLAVTCVAYLSLSRRWNFRQADLLSEALAARFENEDLARRLARQVELVEEANREKDRFLASASHDLRQPLHAISLFTSVLERASLPQPDGITVQRLSHSVRMLGDSLDAMLDISRLDAGAVQPRAQAVAVHDIFMTLQNTFAARAQEKGLQFRVRAPGGVAVMTDAQLLERLLGNLVDNAIKYTHAGGVIVTVRLAGPHSREGMACFEIADTGQGIPAGVQHLVFDEFYQVDNPQRDRRHGLGIGLSIVRRLSDLLGHPVAFRSRPQRGTRFRVWVPLAVGRADPQGLPGARSQPVFDHGLLPHNVLVLDDEEDSREALASLLAAHGCAVHAAGDVEEAECLLSRIEVDAIVADYRLPGSRTGLEFLLALAADRPHVRSLLVTGETARDRIAAIKASGIPCLYKPVRAQALLAALAR